VNDLNEFKQVESQAMRKTTTLSGSQKQFAKCRGEDRGSNALRSTEESSARQETLKWLQQEISFIHNAEFERLDDAKINEEFEQLAIYRDPAGSRKKLPGGLPAYLAHLYEVPLLSPEGEAALFRQMNYLKYQANKLRSRLNPDRANARLVAKIKALMDAADRIRNRLIECNLRLVVSIARKFANDQHPFEELVSEGNLILMKAVEKFDYSRGFRFSTYTTHSVQRHFYRYFRTSRRRKSTEANLPDDHLNDLTGEEAVDETRDAIENMDMELVMSHIDGNLSQRERHIIRERFGLGESKSPRTLKSLSEELDVSKERVRQLHHKAVAEIRKQLEKTYPDLLEEPV